MDCAYRDLCSRRSLRGSHWLSWRDSWKLWSPIYSIRKRKRRFFPSLTVFVRKSGELRNRLDTTNVEYNDCFAFEHRALTAYLSRNDSKKLQSPPHANRIDTYSCCTHYTCTSHLQWTVSCIHISNVQMEVRMLSIWTSGLFILFFRIYIINPIIFK